MYTAVGRPRIHHDSAEPPVIKVLIADELTWSYGCSVLKKRGLQ